MKKNHPCLVLLVVLLLLVDTLPLGAQLGRSLQPSWIHLDKPFYVVGDRVGFQLYLAPEFADENILVQSILFGANGEAVLYNYWRQGEQHVNGEFQLPSNLPTGWYYLSLRAWDENRQTERVLQQAPLAVYNDRKAIEPALVSQQEPARETAAVVLPEKELQLEIVPLRQNQGPGEAAAFEIKVTDRRGRPVEAHCSVSVADWGLLSTAMAMGMDNLQASDSLRVVTPDRLSSRFFWQGELQGAEQAPLADTYFSLQAGAEMQTLSSDERGRFVFLSQAMSADQLSLRLKDGQYFRVRFQPAPGRLALGRLFYSPAAFRYLEVSRQRRAMQETLGMPEVLGLRPNHVTNLQGTFELVNAGASTAGSWYWEQTAQDLPMTSASSWFPKLQSGQDGRLVIRYHHSSEKTAYRVDVVAQDAAGKRGRTSLVYRVGE